MSEMEILREGNLLKPNLLAAHAIHLSLKEIRLLARSGVKVSYNPISNMKLASGTPRVKEMLDLGVTVGLGTDGPASNNSLDLFETMKFAALLQKIHYMNPRVLPIRKVIEMATIDGARALGIDSMVGSIEVGKRADIILLDFNKPHLTPNHNLYANIVYSARGSDVDTVIIDGKIIMRDRVVKTLEESKIIERAKETATDVVTR